MNILEIGKIKIIIFIKAVIFFYFLTLGSAHAYLDPGTGSIILQAIIAAIATVGATASFYWGRIKLKLKILFKKKDKKDLSKN